MITAFLIWQMPVRKGMSFRERAVVKARMASAVLLSPVKKQARYHANSIRGFIPLPTSAHAQNIEANSLWKFLVYSISSSRPPQLSVVSSSNSKLHIARARSANLLSSRASTAAPALAATARPTKEATKDGEIGESVGESPPKKPRQAEDGGSPATETTESDSHSPSLEAEGSEGQGGGGEGWKEGMHSGLSRAATAPLPLANFSPRRRLSDGSLSTDTEFGC